MEGKTPVLEQSKNSGRIPLFKTSVDRRRERNILATTLYVVYILERTSTYRRP